VFEYGCSRGAAPGDADHDGSGLAHKGRRIPLSETIFEALRESHETQRSLMRKLLRSESGAHRVDIFSQLRIELSAHEAAEERYLYVEILMDDRGLNSARDALADHHKMDELVEQLQTRNHAGVRWMNKLKNLAEQLHEHLNEEEKIFFQISGKILEDRKKVVLAKKYRRELASMRKKLESA
jgi:hemerythrin superfamily protein